MCFTAKREFHYCIDTMVSSSNRQRFTIEDVLLQIQNANDIDRFRGGMDSREESEIDQALLNYDEEPRWMWSVSCGHFIKWKWNWELLLGIKLLCYEKKAKNLGTSGKCLSRAFEMWCDCLGLASQNKNKNKNLFFHDWYAKILPDFKRDALFRHCVVIIIIFIFIIIIIIEELWTNYLDNHTYM